MRNLYYWKKVTVEKKIIKHKYFIDQIKKTKFSTIDFFNFLEKKISIKDKSFIDVGCGNGCNLNYIVKKYGLIKDCLGVDLNPHLIKFANNYFAKKNLTFDTSNIFRIKKRYISQFDVAICLQTLPYLKDYQKALKEISKLKTDYIATSCLLWEGLIDFNIRLNILKNDSHKRPIEYFRYYNIYSLNNYISFMKKLGFKKNFFHKFEIKNPISQNNKKIMGTYTLNEKDKLIQMSGPIKMNWYFILSKKK